MNTSDQHHQETAPPEAMEKVQLLLEILSKVEREGAEHPLLTLQTPDGQRSGPQLDFYQGP